MGQAILASEVQSLRRDLGSLAARLQVCSRLLTVITNWLRAYRCGSVPVSIICSKHAVSLCGTAHCTCANCCGHPAVDAGWPRVSSSGAADRSSSWCSSRPSTSTGQSAGVYMWALRPSCGCPVSCGIAGDTITTVTQCIALRCSLHSQRSTSSSLEGTTPLTGWPQWTFSRCDPALCCRAMPCIARGFMPSRVLLRS